MEEVVESRDRDQQLADAKRQIEQRVNEAREEVQFFVYAAGHDLQQPLRGVLTHAQLLERLGLAEQISV